MSERMTAERLEEVTGLGNREQSEMLLAELIAERARYDEDIARLEQKWWNSAVELKTRAESESEQLRRIAGDVEDYIATCEMGDEFAEMARAKLFETWGKSCQEDYVPGSLSSIAELVGEPTKARAERAESELQQAKARIGKLERLQQILRTALIYAGVNEVLVDQMIAAAPEETTDGND